MTLAEKIAALRGERSLSQGDLAEALDVSRQSVSKWETGQSVPELDKIIKLADLFGVTVDELVRDKDVSMPELARAEPVPAVQPETKIVYVERPRRCLTPVQILGVICAAGGAGLGLLGLYYSDPELPVIGLVLFLAGLPLLLAKKHPLLLTGWLIWGISYLFLCNPHVALANWQPFSGVIQTVRWLIADGGMGGNVLLVILFLLAAYLLLSALTIALPAYTGWLCWKRWKERRAEQEQTA